MIASTRRRFGSLRMDGSQPPRFVYGQKSKCMTRTQTDAREILARRELAILVIVLLAATALRTWRLYAVPPGLTHDEAAHGHDAIAILEGARPIYQTVGYGREPLYDYWIAGLMALGGKTREVLRFSAVPLGLITLLATFAWTRVAFDTEVALMSTAFQSVAFWSLSTGRQALRSSLLAALFTMAIYFFWQSVLRPEGRPARWRLGVFSLLIGATLYTYIPARGLWLIFPLYLAYLAISQRKTFSDVAAPALLAIGIGLLLSLPLFLYLRHHPGAEQRLAMLNAPVEALLRGNPSLLFDRAWGFLLALFIPGRGDHFLAYTIPGRPIFGPILAVLFAIGVGISLTRWKSPAHAFSLIWFLVGIGPSLITGPAASTTRSIAALPVVFLFPAISVVTGVRWAGERWGNAGSWMVGLVSGVLLVTVGISSVRDYFVTWGQSPHTRAAYQHTLVEIAAYLDRRPEDGVVGISTEQPYAPHDPYVFELSLERSDLSVRWFDAQRALVLPRESSVRLVVPSSATPASAFAELAGLVVQERIKMRPNDLDPWFDVYQWNSDVTRAAVLQRIEGCTTLAAWETAMLDNGKTESLDLPADFGGALKLLGYDLLTPTITPGKWEATNPDPIKATDPADVDNEPVIFVHALDAHGAVLSQEDRLDAPAWAWRAGDMILQIHRLALPPEMDPEPVVLSVGVYRPADMSRLPVSVGADHVGDALFFRRFHVEG